MAKQPETKTEAKTDEAPMEAAKTENAVATLSSGNGKELAAFEDDGDILGMVAADAKAGFQHVKTEDRVVPFLRIVQSLSPERNKQKNEYIKNADEGDLFNTLTRDLYKAGEEGPGAFFVPVVYARRLTRWWPRDSKAGKGLVEDYGLDMSMLDEAVDGPKGRKVLTDGTELVVTGEFYGFVVDPEAGYYEPAIISMGGSQIKKGRAWNSKMMNMRVEVGGQRIVPPMFFHAWHIGTKPESNDQGSWYGFDINDPRPILSLSDKKMARNLYIDCREFLKQVEEGRVKSNFVEEGEASKGPKDVGNTYVPDPGAGGEDEIPF